jgi:hypothetical protein
MAVERSITAQAFLDQFPQNRKSTVTNKFLFTVRSGVTEPNAVVSATRRRCAPQFDGDIIDKIDFDEIGARSFANWAVEYEKQPAAERNAQKETKAEQYREEFMKEKPPTERQLAYLQALGYKGEPPLSMKAASDLIERHKRVRT